MSRQKSLSNADRERVSVILKAARRHILDKDNGSKAALSAVGQVYGSNAKFPLPAPIVNAPEETTQQRKTLAPPVVNLPVETDSTAKLRERALDKRRISKRQVTPPADHPRRVTKRRAVAAQSSDPWWRAQALAFLAQYDKS